MMRREVLAFLAVCLLCVSSAWGANSVVVESKSLGVNVIDAPVRVFIDNDADLQGIIVPLVVREVTPGAYPTALKMSYADRLDPSLGALVEISVVGQHDEPIGLCGPSGFNTHRLSDDTLKHPVTANPLGLLFARVRILGPPLTAGSDTKGSMVITMDLGSTVGVFEIDTTCVDPTHHLAYVMEGTSQQVLPLFTKGVITIAGNTPPVAQCTNITVPADGSCTAVASIDAGSFDPDGGPVTLVQDPPGPYPIGITNVRLVVIDELSGTDECFANVTVEDVTPPQIVCHPDTIVVVETGSAGAIVEFETLATDACAAVSINCDPPSGSFFGIGITSVTCVAIDGYGNSATCGFRIVVLDDSAYCNEKPSDINCDGAADATDISLLIDHVYFGAPDPPSCCYGPPK